MLTSLEMLDMGKLHGNGTNDVPGARKEDDEATGQSELHS